MRVFTPERVLSQSLLYCVDGAWNCMAKKSDVPHIEKTKKRCKQKIPVVCRFVIGHFFKRKKHPRTFFTSILIEYMHYILCHKPVNRIDCILFNLLPLITMISFLHKMPIPHIDVSNLLLDSIENLSLVTRNSCLIAWIEMLFDHFHTARHRHRHRDQDRHRY